MKKLSTKSHYIKTDDGNSLHLLEFLPKNANSRPILFIHGAIENGAIFYSKSGKGLAPFLQQNDFHCFVLDLRGRGASSPSLSKKSSFGQRELISSDLPNTFDFIQALKPDLPLCLIGHSWGGVLINSFLLENSKYQKSVSHIAHFAVKRRVSVINLHRFFYIDFAWLFLGSLIVKLWGYLPKGFYGPDGESAGTLKDSQHWVYSKEWIDHANKIDYNLLAKSQRLPKAIYFAGSHDRCMGHPKDVQAFALESGHSKSDVFTIGKQYGFQENYDHISLLTKRTCKNEHFQQLIEFFDT